MDYSVKLAIDDEGASITKWCLQEYDNEGVQVGEDLTPCKQLQISY